LTISLTSRLGHFFRNASIDTTLASPAGSAGFSARWPDFAGAGADGGFAGAVFAGAGAGAERHRWIGEACDRIEGHDQAFGLAGEMEAHFESVLGDDEVPELVLQDDRHLVGKAAPDRGRRDDAGRLGLERDVEVMVADQPRARGVGEHSAHHGAQRVLHQKVVADEVGRHQE
jgi:hypothetical protein